MSKIDFIDWMNIMLEKRKMSKSDLARAGGMSASQITRIMKGDQGAGVDSILGIAKGFGLTPSEVLNRFAGLEPPEKDPQYQKLAGLYAHLSADKKKDLLDYAEYLFER